MSSRAPGARRPPGLSDGPLLASGGARARDPVCLRHSSASSCCARPDRRSGGEGDELVPDGPTVRIDLREHREIGLPGQQADRFRRRLHQRGLDPHHRHGHADVLHHEGCFDLHGSNDRPAGQRRERGARSDHRANVLLDLGSDRGAPERLQRHDHDGGRSVQCLLLLASQDGRRPRWRGVGVRLDVAGEIRADAAAAAG